jgi:hypothetical protein
MTKRSWANILTVPKIYDKYIIYSVEKDPNDLKAPCKLLNFVMCDL